MTRFRPGIRLLAVCLLAGVALAVRADALLDRAQQLLQSGHAGEAYQLLDVEAAARAGDPQFDFLLGVAALESDQAVEAVFALERVIDLEPDNAPARAHLARAYLRVGEMDSAKKEFDTVKAQKVPADVAATIDKYLAVIQYQFDRTRTRYDLYVQTTLGYDTNVNSATDERQVAVPGLGGVLFNLADTSRESDSAIWGLRGGFTFSSPLRAFNDVRLYGGVDLDSRTALEQSEFSTKTGDGAFGLHWLRGADQYRLAVQGQRFEVDGTSRFDADRDLGGLTGQWQHTVDASNQLTAFAQVAAVRYPEQSVRDVNRYAFGAGWGHAFGGQGAPVTFLSVFGGVEDARHDASGGHFGRDFVGVRGGGQYTVNARTTAFGSVTYQFSDYDEADPVFGVAREEDFIDVGVGLRYRWMGGWSVTPELRYTTNDSNVALNDFDRFQVQFTVRNDF